MNEKTSIRQFECEEWDFISFVVGKDMSAE